MDIEELYTLDEAEAGAEVRLKDKRGKLRALYITIVGSESRTWKNASLEMRRKIAQGENAEDARCKAMASCTLSWRGFKSKNKDLKFSKESVENLYKQAPYMLDQVDLFLANRENFMKGKDAS